ncbi:unnamed protein product [Oikopleura dioica]|uniref:Uncharacterized protein n=1 Tax=Oikopleura dioica TaxID=34765 RepID=E4X4W1_OIKDI|nr:unnamed protein product [Oikopleura dioica]
MGELRRTSTLNPEQGELNRLSTQSNAPTRKTSTVTEIAPGRRSIQIRKPSVALHSMDECLPGSNNSNIKNRRESFSVIGNSKEVNSSEESAGSRRLSLSQRSSMSNQRSSIFGRKSISAKSGLEILEAIDITEAINEDENSKKKNNNLIIETKETLMEKQGRRDLIKLQMMFAFFSFITISALIGILIIIYAVPNDSPYQWLVILLAVLTILGSWGNVFCQRWKPPAKTLDMERDERFQNLKNSFLAKEIAEFNRHNKEFFAEEDEE